MLNLSYIYERYTLGESLREIADDFNTSHATLSRKLKSSGYVIYPKRRRLKILNLVCKTCSSKFSRYPSSSVGSFCSKICYNQYRQENKTSANTRDLTSKSYLKVRKTVLDKFKFCVMCLSDKKLHVHHIVPRRLDYTLKEEENNLITLCISCHCSIKGKEEKYIKYFASLVSKVGELLGTPNVEDEGNQQPSPVNDIKVTGKVQRLTGEESTNNPDTSAHHESDDIVRTVRKLTEVVA